jgi:hypothetical protein
MPCSYHIDKGNRCAQLTSCGRVTKEDVLQRLARLFNDPDWTPGYSVVSDYATADGRGMTSEDIDALLIALVRMRSQIAASKIAFVVPSDLTYALANMLVLKGGEDICPMKCFRSRSEALYWLGVREVMEA